MPVKTPSVFFRCTTLLLRAVLCFLLTGINTSPAAGRQGTDAAGPVTVLGELPTGAYEKKWVGSVTQPLDHGDAEAGFFGQRIVVCHRGYDRPVVLVTEGYDLGFLADSTDFRPERERIQEIAERYGANVIYAEHRFFGESVPDTLLWTFLTVAQASADYHRVYELFKSDYPGKWIATGVSKGGVAAVHYQADYPEDMDAVVAYVAPFNASVEDPRHDRFLSRVGDAATRNEIVRYQIEMLRRREEMLPLLQSFSRVEGLRYPVRLEEVYEYLVLEYGFAVWQWGAQELIPPSGSPAEALFSHLILVSPPAYFSDRSMTPFFVQAATELGYYGYDPGPLAGMLCYAEPEGYLKKIFLPELDLPAFDPRVNERIFGYLGRNDPKWMLIYGENDPWSATAIPQEWVEKKENTRIYVAPGGSHLTRIGTFPEETREETREEIWKVLDGWILTD